MVRIDEARDDGSPVEPENSARQPQSFERERLLSAIIEFSDDAIIGKTLDGVIITWNASAEKLLGYSADEAIGKPVSIIVPPERSDELPAILERLRRGELIRHYETVRMRKDSTRIQVSVSVSPIKDSSGRIVGTASINRDITEFKRLELALRESEHRFRFLGENSPDIIYQFRRKPRWAFEYVSPAVTRITGYTPDEFYADPSLLFRLIHPEDRQLLEIVMSNPISPDTPTILRWLRKDGGIIWTEQRTTPICDETGDLVAVEGVARDITSRKQAEEALRVSEEKYRSLFDTAMDAIIVSDEHGRLVDANSQAEPLTGYSRQELLTMSICDFVPSEYREMIRQSFEEGKRIGRQRREYPLLRKDGRLIQIELSAGMAGPDRYQASFRDITGRKRAEADREQLLAEVQRRAQEMDALIEAVGDGISIADSTGRVLRVNGVGRKILGLPPGFAAERVADYVSQLDYRYPDGRQVSPDEFPLLRALKGEAASGEELILIRPDGGRSHLLFTTGIVRDDQGRVQLAMSIYRDITQIRSLEQAREEFISVIAHDLRSPITVITGFAGLLQRLSPDRHGTPQEQKAVESILASAARLGRMVTDLLDASRLEAKRLSLSKERVVLPGFVEDVTERIMETTKGHPVRVQVHGEVSVVMADPARLEQVLENLLSNAAKYSYPNAEILVEMQSEAEEVVVSVANQGPGIPDEDREKIFTRFHRTRLAMQEKVPGLGLGLYITKGLVEAHGGRIWVENEPNRTTTFRFTLPLSGE